MTHRDLGDEAAQPLQVIRTDASNIIKRLRQLGVRDSLIEECQKAIDRNIERLDSTLREHQEIAERLRKDHDTLLGALNVKEGERAAHRKPLQDWANSYAVGGLGVERDRKLYEDCCYLGLRVPLLAKMSCLQCQKTGIEEVRGEKRACSRCHGHGSLNVRDGDQTLAPCRTCHYPTTHSTGFCTEECFDEWQTTGPHPNALDWLEKIENRYTIVVDYDAVSAAIKEIRRARGIEKK